jgi:beta-ribofuranosylaminobenzene 5'-phosphate synthase
LHDGISQPAGINVTVPARLHLGFLDLNGGLGRRFGGIGIAISRLATKAKVQTGKPSESSGPELDRAQEYLRRMEQVLGFAGSHSVTVMETVPAHSGLGSGTQLALAVAAGLRRLHNLPLDVEGDAVQLGRGGRSGIGIGLFHRGGLVVDGGRGHEPTPAPIISHLPFPDSWRVLVILDPQSHGAHGPDEVMKFAALPPMSDAAVAQICRLMLMKALPAFAECDLANFGAAIREVQMRLGDYFAPAQDGMRFASPRVAAILSVLDGAGAHGVGQSSWGPTGFAFAASPEEADRLAGIARRDPASGGLDIRVCSGLNRGAEIVARTRAH